MEERNKKYGDFYQITFNNTPPTIMTSHPQAIEDIFTTSPDKFDVGIGNKGLNFLLGNRSLILLDGKAHKNRRRLLMPSFHGESLQECSIERQEAGGRGQEEQFDGVESPSNCRHRGDGGVLNPRAGSADSAEIFSKKKQPPALTEGNPLGLPSALCLPAEG